MISPDALTFKDVADVLYDFSAVTLVATLVWKSRGIYDEAKAFFKKANRHMDVVEQGMSILLTNHAPHIETYLRTLASREGELHAEDNNRMAFGQERDDHEGRGTERSL